MSYSAAVILPHQLLRTSATVKGDEAEVTQKHLEGHDRDTHTENVWWRQEPGGRGGGVKEDATLIACIQTCDS